jgi:hypothetical protein
MGISYIRAIIRRLAYGILEGSGRASRGAWMSIQLETSSSLMYVVKYLPYVAT